MPSTLAELPRCVTSIFLVEVQATYTNTRVKWFTGENPLDFEMQKIALSKHGLCRNAGYGSRTFPSPYLSVLYIHIYNM